jgi:putative two-component system response regulator
MPMHDTIRILIVDDEEPIRMVFHIQLTNAGYECRCAENGRHALEILRQHPADIVITDIKMPDMSGIELVNAIKEHHHADIIVMSGYAQDFAYDKIIELGARDFIQKPVTAKELLVRLKRVVRERLLLAEREQQHQELKSAYLDTINRLALAAEYKDEDTADHLVRISRYSTLLATKLGLPPDMVINIQYAAPMHDIGKMGIPDSILLKPGRLTPAELQVVKSHTTIGAKILAHSKSEILRLAHDTALTHHEKWDGTGYPRGLSGADIPLIGRIVGLVDVYDALTTVRPYKNPYPEEIALEIIQRERGRHTDPELTDVFLASIDDILQVKKEVGQYQEIPLHEIIWSERDREAYPQMAKN